MRKSYPYLQDSFYEDANGARQRRNFLKSIDSFVNQKQYVKLTLLNWSEEPLKEIQGVITSGTLTKDGSSSVRRTCSLTTTVGAGEYDIENLSYDFGINKKIFVEIGVKNYTDQYPEYPILWFPQGVFFISSATAASSASSSVTINLSLKDKMCGLNGEVGGTFPAAVILDEMDTQDASGAYVTEKVLIYNIIKEVVNHYGGEDLNNIVIEDVPLRIKRIMKWTGSDPLWLIPHESGSAGMTWYEAALEKPENVSTGTIQVTGGSDAGYIYDDFVYDTELSCNLGETVTSVLDKIKQYLGNYEYFYDEFGVFHFREIKNYLNTTQAKVLLDDMQKKDYLVDVTTGKTVYTFNDKDNIISINTTPQFNNIKNDYVIQGKRKSTVSSQQINVRYHLAIDRKPYPIETLETGEKIYNRYQNLLLFTEESTNLTKACFPIVCNSRSELPLVGNFNPIYYIYDEKKALYWDNEYKEVKVVKYYSSSLDPYEVRDWRTELYLEGLLAKNLGLDSGNYYAKINDISGWQQDILKYAHNCRIDTDYYFEELDAFWPQIYNLETQRFYGEEEDATLLSSSLADGNYYLDFIDSSTSGFSQYSVSAIGRRTDAVSSDTVNCLFQPEIPNIVFINADSDDREAVLSEIEECNKNGLPYTQVRGEVYYTLATGGYKNSAFDQVKYELYLHTTYQKSVSISAMPVFYLEPNSRVFINDASTNTYGDFNLTNLSIPLGPGGTMSASMSQAVERF